ncbi:MAG: hypothetical protein WBO97_12120 [Tepidiformaceae bacterium]
MRSLDGDAGIIADEFVGEGFTLGEAGKRHPGDEQRDLFVEGVGFGGRGDNNKDGPRMQTGEGGGDRSAASLG